MFGYRRNLMNNLSVFPMDWHRNGLTLSYSFLV